MTSFAQFLDSHVLPDGLPTEDVLAAILPLIEQVAAAHIDGRVAPLNGIDHLNLDGRVLCFSDEATLKPQFNTSKVRALQATSKSGVSVVRSWDLDVDLTTGAQSFVDLAVLDSAADVQRPGWVSGFRSWEHVIGHHDPLTDVFSLGLLLATLSCGLDFRSVEDLQRFAQHRRNLFRLRPDLHPVLARVIVLMTELNRHERPADLLALRTTLQNYRDHEVDFETDLARDAAMSESIASSPTVLILSKLRERLFEINRRNRLLQFRATGQSINLTVASIPLSFDVESIRPQQVLTWDGSFRSRISAGKPVVLNRFLNVREAVYLPGAFQRIRTEARRDENDYGFAQLRLIIAFLRWSDLKTEPPERYESPLLLVPVQLSVRRGIHDRYVLQALDRTAEVNPVVRHQFQQLYGMELPESVELSKAEVQAFVSRLQQQISDSDPSVTLQSVERPRLEIMHAKARRRLDQHERRVRVSTERRSETGGLTYSYDAIGYTPLGIQLFETFVRTPEPLLQQMVQTSGGHAETSSIQQRGRKTTRADQASADSQANPSSREAEGKFYPLLDETDDNPRHWEVDFCSVTLANLKYRRMSLARDYAQLISAGPQNAAFDATFSLTDSPPFDAEQQIPIADRYNVLPADPTQMSAVARSTKGHSYIIQGPPGTGKSQTIANLISQLVQQGCRILFVCEKRAAVDVVHHRLKQLALADLCCLIHDSQADKKQFVMDLKQAFEGFLNEAAGPPDDYRTARDRLAAQMQQTLSELQQVDVQMTSTLPNSDLTIRDLYDRLLDEPDEAVVLPPAVADRIPTFDVWLQSSSSIELLRRNVERLLPEGVVASHAVSLLSSRLLDVQHPVEQVQQVLAELLPALRQLVERLQDGWPPEMTDSFSTVRSAVEFASEVRFLTDRSLLGLLLSDSPLRLRFMEALKRLQNARQHLAEAEAENIHWNQKLPSQDTLTALQIVKDLESSWQRWLSPRWWQVRRQVKAAYDFSQHAIAPTFETVLEKLDQEYERQAECYRITQEIGEEFDLHLQLDEFLQRLESVEQRLAENDTVVAAFAAKLSNHREAVGLVQAAAETQPLLNDATVLLDRLMQDYQHSPVEQLLQFAEQLQHEQNRLPELLHCLKQLCELDDRIELAVRTVPVTFKQLELASVRRSLKVTELSNPTWAAFSPDARDAQLERLRQLHDQLQQANAKAVREQVCRQFCDRIALTERPAGQLDDDQKEFRKRYSRGRKVLQHEFGKSMRYKSIRELAGGDSGQVVRDLKPVWLMSPLSVSDTLPLDEQHFDTVIFDEASQITLEDAVPALFRSAQAIVVGDEMQLPPTSFFNTRSDDDDELFLEEDGQQVHYDLNSSSLLNHAAQNLPSTLLGWHYRSQSESLISFSNHAFYAGRLLTVPEERLTVARQSELCISNCEDAREATPALLQRAVSFHFLQNGVYEKRQNKAEADYIAQTIRCLLMDSSVTDSIGIVAFSEAQQSRIESSIQRLAAEDGDFAERLEAELEREDDGQFAGLLIRNLENIQGDERDIIILSVCYGPDSEGRIRMNFGPINMAGGEKRLNVAFTRARRHMALVSSMRHTAITNDYNDGANCLKNYLRYAEACSAGRVSSVNDVLRSLSGVVGQDGDRSSPDVLQRQLADALVAKGYEVDFGVGQSAFKVDLAVRRAGDRQYRLGILTDSTAWYAQPDLLERELLKPQLLRHFGWPIEIVHARDWYERTDECRRRLLAAIAGPP
ncbi:MAG: WGR domain-containing protein [Fuerstiella sp.]